MSALSKASGINKTTIFRILTTLKASYYVQQDPKTKTYSLGISFFRLGRIVASELQIKELARPFMEEARDSLCETIVLYVHDNVHKVCIEKVDFKQPIMWVIEVGDSAPLYSAAGGLVLLAYLENSETIINEMELKALTPYTITDIDFLKQRLSLIRERGYDISLNERFIGAKSIAAPIFDSANKIVASIAVLAPEFRLNGDNESRAIEVIKDSAAKVSANL